MSKKYLDPLGVSRLWREIKDITKHHLVYYSKTTQEWNEDIHLLSQKDVLYIYVDYKTIQQNGEEIVLPGLKIGDGTSYLIDLPFLNKTSNIEDQMINHINNNTIHVTLQDRIFWNNKINLELEDENLILNRN